MFFNFYIRKQKKLFLKTVGKGLKTREKFSSFSFLYPLLILPFCFSAFYGLCKGFGLRPDLHVGCCSHFGITSRVCINLFELRFVLFTRGRSQAGAYFRLTCFRCLIITKFILNAIHSGGAYLL